MQAVQRGAVEEDVGFGTRCGRVAGEGSFEVGGAVREEKLVRAERGDAVGRGGGDEEAAVGDVGPEKDAGEGGGLGAVVLGTVAEEGLGELEIVTVDVEAGLQMCCESWYCGKVVEYADDGGSVARGEVYQEVELAGRCGCVNHA